MNWRKHAFLLGHDLIGSKLRANYREFLEAGSWSTDRLQQLHDQRLASLLSHAATNVPFYKSRVSKPELSTFPILRKEDIHNSYEDLMEPSLLEETKAPSNRKGYGWVKVGTGGSTGKPTIVIHDKDFRDWGRAGRLYSQHLCGFPIGNAFFMLWGSMRDINDAKDSTTKRILNALLQVHPLNAFLMNDERMSAYAKEIHDSSINHLMAYVDAAYQLARYIEKNKLPMRPIKSIMACAGTVKDEFRSTLANVFHARVHNKYGSRECADMACECASGGFHIYHTGVHIEIVDEHGNPVPAGVTGRILVTLLLNRRFPLIRYEIGDIGALSDATCQCGSPLPLLDRVEGRITEVITSAAGTYVSPLYFCHLVGVVHNPGSIERFQFTQSGAAEYSLALQLEDGFSDTAFASLTAKLLSDFSKVLGSQAKISFERVANIAPSASGKYLYVRNLHRKP